MDIHPLIVHFPIALLITGFVFATIELGLKKECKCKSGFTIEPFTIQKTAYYLLILGSLSAVVAVLSGFIFTSDMEGVLGELRCTHLTIAIITASLSILSAISYTFYVFKHSKKARVIGYVLYLICAVLIGTTGYFGGEIVFMFR
ncbi:MAG TPA: hypothetical protein DD434_10285 [Bacteroidales bacterium]|nr:hypothetical protein [Bacteroidales bacterium]